MNSVYIRKGADCYEEFYKSVFRYMENVTLPTDYVESVKCVVNRIPNPEDRRIISLRYGLFGETAHTVKEVGNLCNCSRKSAQNKLSRIELELYRNYESKYILLKGLSVYNKELSDRERTKDIILSTSGDYVSDKLVEVFKELDVEVLNLKRRTYNAVCRNFWMVRRHLNVLDILMLSDDDISSMRTIGESNTVELNNKRESFLSQYSRLSLIEFQDEYTKKYGTYDMYY